MNISDFKQEVLKTIEFNVGNTDGINPDELREKLISMYHEAKKDFPTDVIWGDAFAFEDFYIWLAQQGFSLIKFPVC